MTRDLPSTINLEVTVPRIILPLMDEKSEERKKAVKQELAQQRDDDADKEFEQVRLLALHAQKNQQSSSENESDNLQGKASTHVTRDLPFRLFRILDIVVEGKTHIVQVLRLGKKQIRKRSNNRASRLHWVSDELPIHLEYRNITSGNKLSTTPRIIPGLTQVVIFLDEEGTPNSYMIDGAES